MKWAISTMRIPTIVLFISLLVGQSPFLIDSTITSTIPQSISNSIQIGDINNDGYNDIIYSGYDPTRFGLFVDVLTGNREGTLSINYQTNFPTYPDTIAEYLYGSSDYYIYMYLLTETERHDRLTSVSSNK